MNEILRVNGLCKAYSAFRLEDVSFAVEKGSIMGFIGRNGAGKTTTLRSIMNLVHPDGGEISFFGLPMAGNEDEIKQRVGFAAGGVNYYQRKRLRDIAAVTGRFYKNWDESAYRTYMERFSLDDGKRPMELSEGMKVKFNLAVALSHRAELLILDEPTSGLDPVSREELLEIFLSLASEGVAILFSTHITSDLEKCADGITYIKNGHILASQETDAFRSSWRIIPVSDEMTETQRAAFIGVSRSRTGSSALIRTEDTGLFPDTDGKVPELETIMVHLEKEGQ